MALFCGQPTLKVVLFDAEFDSASNSTSLRVNSGKTAYRDRKYLPKRPFGPVLEVQVVLFCGQPTSKVVPFDAEFESASNSTSLRVNSGKTANRGWKNSNRRLTFPTFSSVIVERMIPIRENHVHTVSSHCYSCSFEANFLTSLSLSATSRFNSSRRHHVVHCSCCSR